VAANAILKEALAIARKKATVDGKGNYIATPSITVYKAENATVRVGKFYHSGTGVYIGAEVEIGDSGRQTMLYPVDTTQIKHEFKFEYKNKDDDNG